MLRPRLSLAPLAFVALLGTASPLLAQEPPTVSRIEVEGEGTVYRAPDLATTQLTVLRNAPTAAEGLAEVNKAIGDVSAAMAEFGVEKRDLRTVGFQISPQYQYDNRQDGPQAPPKLVGYEVRNTLSVKVRDLSKLGALLDKAVTLGVNEGGSIQFEIDNPTEATQEARRLAVVDAKARAQTLAEASGLKLGRVLLIQDGAIRREPSPPIPFAEMKLAAAPASGRVPVEIGENAVRADIRVVYEMQN